MSYAPNGDYYVSGYFSGTIDLDPGPGTRSFTTNTGGPDNYLAKFNADGSLDWAWRQTCYQTDDRIWDIETDLNGDVIVTGSFRQTVDFDPGSGTFNLTANGGSGGGTDIFIAKYSSGGNLIFAKGFGSFLNDGGQKLASSEDGFIYLAGYFQDAVDFVAGSSTFSLSSKGAIDGFFLKIDSAGELVWVKGIGGTGDDYADIISLSPEGKVLVGGTFWGTIDLDPGQGVNLISSTGQSDIFFGMFDENGEFDWGQSLEGVNSDILGKGLVDHEGHLVFTGLSSGGIDFDPSSAVFNLPLNTSSSSFLARYSIDGSFEYAFYLSDQEVVSCVDLIEDKFGNLCLTGAFRNSIDLDPGPGTAILNSPDRDIYFAKYDLNGNFRWAYGIRGDGTDFAGGLDISPSGEIILVGSSEERTDFNIGIGIDTVPWNGYLDAFVARYDQCLSVFPDTQSVCPDQTYLFGNQTLNAPGDYVQTFSLGGCDSILTLNLSIISVDTGVALQGYDLVSSVTGASYQWINCSNSQAIAGATSGIFTPTEPGNYAVVVTENGCTDTSACIAIATVGNTRSIDLASVRMYPNPVEDVVNLEFSRPVKLSSIQVYDLTGRMLVSELVNGMVDSYSLKLLEVPSGMYLVALAYTDGSQQVGRILVR